MARDELRYLGPIYTFYCLTSGMTQLACYRYSGLVDLAEENLAIISRALQDLSKRWPSAVGSLKHLYVGWYTRRWCIANYHCRMDVREKVIQRPSLGHFPDISLPSTTLPFFSDFGPDLCRMWHPIYERVPQSTCIAPQELETAGILQGLRTPATQTLDLDMGANAAAQQMLNNHMNPNGVSLEPTLLQPQEWFGPYTGIGNWLMVDWDQGLGW